MRPRQSRSRWQWRRVPRRLQSGMLQIAKTISMILLDESCLVECSGSHESLVCCISHEKINMISLDIWHQDNRSSTIEWWDWRRHHCCVLSWWCSKKSSSMLPLFGSSMLVKWLRFHPIPNSCPDTDTAFPHSGSGSTTLSLSISKVAHHQIFGTKPSSIFSIVFRTFEVRLFVPRPEQPRQAYIPGHRTPRHSNPRDTRHRLLTRYGGITNSELVPWILTPLGSLSNVFVKALR